MYPLVRRVSVVAVVALVVLGTVHPGVAVASAGGERAIDAVAADRPAASTGSQWEIPAGLATLLWGAAAESNRVAHGVRGAIDPGEGIAAVEPVDGCRVIDSPGAYELPADVTDSTNTTCIDVRSSDVLLDGNGHGLPVGVGNARSDRGGTR